MNSEKIKWRIKLKDEGIPLVNGSVAPWWYVRESIKGHRYLVEDFLLDKLIHITQIK